MPASAVALLLFFTGAAIVIGILATWVTGPRRPIAVAIPTLAAFGALYLVGHKSGLAAGPTVQLFGFEVNLLFDLGAAALGAAIAAIAQCMVLGRLRRGGAGA
jgi:hypothetical protein